MLRSARALNAARVLTSLSASDIRSLEALAPELEIYQAEAGDLARRALDLQPRVVVLADPDPARGLRTVQLLRAAHADARILFLTPSAAEQERLLALEAGVDESLANTVKLSELAGRIRLLLRHARPPRRTRLPIGDSMQLDVERRELLRDGDWIHLRPKEAKLLELFARTPDQVHTRDHILERVWGAHHDGDPRTVDVHVRWLRAKIEPHPHDPIWLVTVRGVGYRLEAVPLTKR